MRVSATLSVKGTYYYKALELSQNGMLSIGLEVRLVHEPDNPYDKYAVAVLLKKTGDKLGHISRKSAPKYAALVNSGSLIEAKISDISQGDASVSVNIRVLYDESDDKLSKKHNSVFWKSASSLPNIPGVYSIRNLLSGRQYIGSTKELKKRVYHHISDLISGDHANHILQSDFSKHGLNNFESAVIIENIPIDNLAVAESSAISERLEKGIDLYNLTEDGQGSGWNSSRFSTADPISDRHASRRGKAIPLSVEANRTNLRINNQTLDSKGSQSCFIATACFGSCEADTVIVFRRFREIILKKSSIGRRLIYWYYKASPSVANFIKSHQKVKSLVRKLLTILANRLVRKYKL